MKIFSAHGQLDQTFIKSFFSSVNIKGAKPQTITIQSLLIVNFFKDYANIFLRNLLDIDILQTAAD